MGLFGTSKENLKASSSYSLSNENREVNDHERKLFRRQFRHMERKAQRQIDKFPRFSRERRLSIGELQEIRSVDSQEESLEDLHEFTRSLESYHQDRKEFQKNEKRAKVKDPVAQYELGCAFHYGTHGQEEDQDLAIRWWTKSARQGHLESQLKLAWMYENDPEKRDSLLEWTWLSKAAEQGDIHAQMTVAKYYKNGRFAFYDDGQGLEEERIIVPANVDLCLEWYERAARQGDIEAQHELADVHAELYASPIRKTDRDDDDDDPVEVTTGNSADHMQQAINWWKSAAQQGHAISWNKLGNHYYGEGNDLLTAAKCWERAADRGIADSEIQLAYSCFWKGHCGVQRNYQVSSYYYHMAQQQHDNPRESHLLLRVRKDIKGFKKDLLEQAARENVNAQRALAFCCETGLFMDKTNDWNHAEEWRSKADTAIERLTQRVNADPNAPNIDQDQWKLANYLLQDLDFQRKLDQFRHSNSSLSFNDRKDHEVITLLQRAAEKGHLQAQERLAHFYYRGKVGVNTSFQLAVRWSQKVAQEEANNATSYASMRSGDDMSTTIAMAYFTLGNCYFFGRGVPKDLAQAMECYHRSFCLLQRYQHPTSHFATIQVIERRYQSIRNKAEEGDRECQKAAEHCAKLGLFVIKRTPFSTLDQFPFLGLCWNVATTSESRWFPLVAVLGLTAIFVSVQCNSGVIKATGK